MNENVEELSQEMDETVPSDKAIPIEYELVEFNEQGMFIWKNALVNTIGGYLSTMKEAGKLKDKPKSVDEFIDICKIDTYWDSERHNALWAFVSYDGENLGYFYVPGSCWRISQSVTRH